MNLATKNFIVGMAAAGLLLTTGVFAAEKKDSTTTKGPNVIVGEVAMPNKKGRPTAMLVGDTIMTATGLKYIEVRTGTGGMPRVGQTVSIHYVGTFRDGKQFLSTRDSSVAYEFEIGKGSVVKGLEEGVASMHIGSIRKLIVPYQLAWGDKGDAKRVPPKTDVIFEVELLEVK